MQGVRRKTHNAITFIELLVVIIIIGILAGVSIPQLKKTFDNFELDNFAKDIYYLCQFLQSSAISQVKTHLLKINKNVSPVEFNASYQVENEDGEKSYTAVEGRFGNTYKVPQEVSIEIEQTGKASPPNTIEIYFYPDGSMGDTDTTITFKNNHDHKLSLIIKGASGGIKIE